MSVPQIAIGILPITCRFYGLTLRQSAEDSLEPEDILMADRPFQIQATLEWKSNAAIALLSLQPEIAVEFFAKPAGIGEGVDLGVATEIADPDQRLYTLALDLESPADCGLATGIHHLGALLRIGAPDAPALLYGVLEGSLVEVFSPIPKNQALERNGATGQGRNGARRRGEGRRQRAEGRKGSWGSGGAEERGKLRR